MNKNYSPEDQVLWFNSKKSTTSACTQNMHIEVAIVGGGMAGLSAAQEFAKKGKKVAVFEKNFCGSGASGKSSGFVTQNAELSLTDFSKRYNLQIAHKIWNLIESGVQNIRNNIELHNFDCDYQAQNAYVLACSTSDLKTFQTEHENLEKIGYRSTLYDQNSLQQIINSKQYFGALEYPKSFGLDPYLYCQALKSHLETVGVQIFEQTQVTQICGHTISTPQATITADFIVVCIDQSFPDLNLLADDVYHAQTFVMASNPLTTAQVHEIFPSGNAMAWDTQLIYNYFRMTKDQRLLLGGGDIFTSYASSETHNYARITKKLCDYFAKYFPKINFEIQYQWPGLIGLSKDIAPMIGREKNHPHIYFVTAATGLAIAAALGVYSAQALLDNRNDLDHYFSPYRIFPIGGCAQKILGKKLSFIFSNLIKLNIP